jgi:hypothetical protein
MRHETKPVFPMGQEERKDEKIYLARRRILRNFCSGRFSRESNRPIEIKKMPQFSMVV